MRRNRDLPRQVSRLAMPLGVAALVIATYTHAIMFTVPKGSIRGNGSSRGLVSRHEWDMSESKHIPEWLVLLSREPKSVEEWRKNKGRKHTNYLYDGNFMGFGILYESGLMLAHYESVHEAAGWTGVVFGRLSGWDMVHQRPRLGPLETTWHPINESYRWHHMVTFGSTNIGIYRIQYDQHRFPDERPQGMADPERPKDNPWRDDASVEASEILDEDQDDARVKFRPSYKPRPRTTTTSTTRRTTTRDPNDEYGNPTPAPPPAKYWRIPVWQWTDPGISNEGTWVYPERPILDINCWAYSYAAYHDGTEPDPREPPKTRFWARWPVRPVTSCQETRPWCKFTFDSERAIPSGSSGGGDIQIRPQGFPCNRWQDAGAPVFCSEDKIWSDQADPTKMELSYMIHPKVSFDYKSLLNRTFTRDMATDCYKEATDTFWAVNLQNMTFLLKDPRLMDKRWKDYYDLGVDDIHKIPPEDGGPEVSR